jgi:hypothetical protein
MEVSSDGGGVIHTAYALRLVVLYQVARIFVWTLYHRPCFSVYCRVSCGHQRVIVEMDLDMTKTRSDTAIHQVRRLHWHVLGPSVGVLWMVKYFSHVLVYLHASAILNLGTPYPATTSRRNDNRVWTQGQE